MSVHFLLIAVSGYSFILISKSRNAVWSYKKKRVHRFESIFHLFDFSGTILVDIIQTAKR